MLKTFIDYYRDLRDEHQSRKKTRQFEKDKQNYSHVYDKAMTTYRQYKNKKTSPHEKESLVRVLQHHQSELKRMGSLHHPDIKIKDHYGFIHNEGRKSPLKYWNINKLHRFSKEFSYSYPEMEKLSHEKGGDLPEEFYSNSFVLHPSDRKLIKNEIDRREFLNAKF